MHSMYGSYSRVGVLGWCPMTAILSVCSLPDLYRSTGEISTQAAGSRGVVLVLGRGFRGVVLVLGLAVMGTGVCGWGRWAPASFGGEQMTHL